MATALVFPFVGALIYMVLRPPEYLDDVRERELEIRAMERRLGGDRVVRTAGTRSSRLPRLPALHEQLKTACRRCKSPLEPDWQLCPYCETAVTRAAEPIEI